MKKNAILISFIILVSLFSDSCEEHNFDNPVDPFIKLPEPHELQASATADSVISLSWKSGGMKNATAMIELKKDKEAWTTIGNTKTNYFSYKIDKENVKRQNYFLRVYEKIDNNKSDYSNEVMVTIPIPNVPILISPLNGATDISITPTLSWQASKGAKSYTLQVSTSSSFSNLFFNKDVGNVASKQLEGLSENTNYYWRVNAISNSGTSAFTSQRSFITGKIPPIPVLIYPWNGAIDVSTEPILSWQASAGAKSYVLQVSTAPDFNNLLFNSDVGNATSKQLNNLNPLTNYYWRVNVKNNIGTSEFSKFQRFTTTSGTIPQPPTLQSPHNEANEISLSPTFNWQLSIGATNYTLQVSTTSDFHNVFFNGDVGNVNSKQLIGLNGLTKYYWRLNAKNSLGTSAFPDTWSFTTNLGTVPQAPTLISPNNGATEISISPTLSWQASLGATNYILQVSLAPNFTSILFNSDIGNVTSKQLSALTGLTTYYWRISAKNVLGTSAFSDTWRFTTNLGAVPQAPTLISPINGAAEISISPTLSWQASNGATNYTLQVSTTSDFQNLFFNDDLGNVTNKQLSSLNALTTYYWRVSAKNNVGTSLFSDTWSFTTNLGSTPQPPILTSPVEGAVEVSVNPILAWNASTGATSYELQVSANSDFTNLIYNVDVGNVTGKQISGLNVLTTYYWRVSAKNSIGVSSYSNTWSFTTILGTIPQPPILTSPVDGAVEVSVNPILAWNASTGATSYVLQVSTNSDFTNLFYNSDVGNVTSKQLSELNGITTYYWRVSAKNSLGTSVFSSIRSFTTNYGVISQPPTLLSPADGGIEISLTPTLSWTVSLGATSYELQVSTNSDFTNLFYNSDVGNVTSKQISGLNGLTTYYWRVSAKNSVGVSAYSGTWSFTTILGTIPQPPILISPLHGAVEVSLNPILAWNASTGATSYILQVSTNSSFANLLFSQDVGNVTSKQISGLNGLKTYYWRVSAKNSLGTSAFSSIRSFTTNSGTIPQPPVLTSPANGAVEVSVLPILIWDASTGATNYELQVSTNSDFTNLFYDSDVGNVTFKQLNGLSGLKKYYWRVSAKNSLGTSAFSSTRSFTTNLGAIPQPPILTSPLHGAVEVSLNPILAWNASTGATSYILQVSTNSSFANLLFSQDVGNVTSKQIIGLNGLTTYYWRVSAKNSLGTSAFSSIRSFTTNSGTIPQPPVLTSPANGAVEVSLNPILAWNTSTGATNYELQVSTNSDFTNLFYDSDVGNVTFKQLNGLSGLKKYYWRVSAKNSLGTSAFSSTRSFTTNLGAIPQPPVLTSPANGAVEVSLNPILAWNTSTGATNYELQVSTNSDFTNLIYNGDVGNLTSKQISELNVLTIYYWRVRAKNGLGTSAFSSIWRFTTNLGTIPQPPTLISPNNGETILSLSPTLLWDDSRGATGYILQVSTTPDFTNIFFYEEIGNFTFQQLKGLNTMTTYFWRVSAKNMFGQSEFSEIKNFITSSLIMTFVEGGTFLMGSNDGKSDEKPVHEVKLRSFYIGKYEVTQKEWVEIMGSNPSYYKGDNLPVESVTWNDVQEFLRKLNEKTGEKYRLPTEAEWEYAARGGNKSKGYTYSGSDDINEVGWYYSNSGNKTHEVGTKQPNELGIYDMSGNAQEWCSDWYDASYYQNSSYENPTGPASGSLKVQRGGAESYIMSVCRVANREKLNPQDTSPIYSFRIAKDKE